MAEGCGLVALETLEHARKRKADILAEIVGYGMSCDAYHITAPEPSGDGAIRAMGQALEWAQMRPEEIDCIFAHGTSTPLNDVVETRAIRAVFRKHAYRLAVSATKSMVGHLLGAAGAISTLAAVLAIRHSVVPPTINLETPDPECDLDYVPRVARQAQVDIALSNSFGLGGQNACLVLGRYMG